MKRMLRIIRDLLLAALILLFAGLAIVRLDDANQQVLAGRPRVVDGDTLIMDGHRIRLAGIDAPELRQVCQLQDQDWPCGAAAKDRLKALIGSAKASCSADGSDRYNRLLAVCSVGDMDLNAAMVASGYAVSFGDYQAEEGAAREKRYGLWAGTFDQPRTWRQTHGAMDEVPHMPDGWLRTGVAELSKRLEALYSRVVND